MKRAVSNKILRVDLVLIVLVGVVLATPVTAQDKPNILVVWGDDLGQSNISAYTMGVMGYRTPNIDRIANEGMIFNLRRDPYERAETTSNTYYDWLLDRAYLLVPAQTYVGQFMATFQEFPPRQKAASFSLDQVMEKLAPSGG